MFSINKESVIVPLDVPKAMRETYLKNYMEITKGVGKLTSFAGEQKAKHLKDGISGKGMSENSDPKRLFIATQTNLFGAFNGGAKQ